jgi:hypothetical protein
MRVTEDEAQFDRQQLQLAREIARVVRQELLRGGVAAKRADKLTESLTFQLTALLDGDHGLELDGRPLVPVVTFATNEERTELLGNAGGSWMHEYAIGIAEGVCSDDS